VREIACDESGYEGEKLIDTTTDVFAHASLDLDPGTAADCLSELRRRVRSPATQYKSGHLLREKSRPALEWFLGPAGPVYGRGHVFLIDKAYFVATRIAALFGVAVADTSPRFLAAANDLLRGKDQPGVVDEFFRVAPGLAAGRDRAELFRAWLREDPVTNSVLDPLVPAIVAAVRFWGPVTVAHDRQTQLPAARVARLAELCDGALLGVRFLDAVSHPRIQLADILAGTVRKIASDQRAGRADPVLAELARPYVDAASIGPTWIRPAWIGPASVGPASVGPASVGPASVGPASVRPGPLRPAPGAGTTAAGD
jgi:hypothetical protein